MCAVAKKAPPSTPTTLLQIDGVSFVAQTIAARQVAVVLDLDATLLESEHLPVEPAGW